MCGLAGMVGPGIDLRSLDAFEDLLSISSLRGIDSTGIFATWTESKNKTWSIEKDTVNSAEFAETNTLTKGMFYDLFIGHARWATVGQVNKANSHPFKVGHLAGAHNGTLKDIRFLGRGKTDSELMFEEMAEKGVVETLSNMLESSAWAVSVWDEDKKKLYLGRNKHRPLYIAFDEERSVMYWASEESFLQFLTLRSISTSKGELPPLNLDIYELAENFIYEINPSEISLTERTPWVSHEIKPIPVEKFVWGVWDGWEPVDMGNSTTSINKSAKESASVFSTKIAHNDDLPWGDAYEVDPNHFFDFYCDDCGQEINPRDVECGDATTRYRGGVEVHVCLECRKSAKKFREVMDNMDPDKSDKPKILI